MHQMKIFLPPPTEGGYVFGAVCLSVCPSDYSQTCERILMKFFGGVGHSSRTKWYNFGGDPDHASDPGVQSPKSGSRIGGGLFSVSAFLLNISWLMSQTLQYQIAKNTNSLLSLVPAYRSTQMTPWLSKYMLKVHVYMFHFFVCHCVCYPVISWFLNCGHVLIHTFHIQLPSITLLHNNDNIELVLVWNGGLHDFLAQSGTRESCYIVWFKLYINGKHHVDVVGIWKKAGWVKGNNEGHVWESEWASRAAYSSCGIEQYAEPFRVFSQLYEKFHRWRPAVYTGRIWRPGQDD